ncbi:MAG: anaerobic ribonucleoside-triphosphate reductase activating protein [Oscillospiraceae bacterium]|nr:anaerobic ribonucleoside-triphosphate reductase activating protein [Oscillospiraceae bacterium]
MRIGGIQKLTLLDYPGKVACTVFTVGCNFRCPFCHNASLVTHTEDAPDLGEEDVLSFLSKRKGIIEGVCITGGEPLIWPETVDLLRKIKSMGYSVKLDTNGSFPKRLADIMDAGLADYIAMDIKSSPQNYALAAGCENALESVKESVLLLLNGKIPFEFRTTVVKGLHTPADIEDIAAWIVGAERYYLQGFRDSGDLIGSGLAAFTPEEMIQLLTSARKYLPNTEIRGE